MSAPVDALLPVLVAELADASARRMVAELAEARATAFVPLLDAPVDASLHVLEVTTPGEVEPLLVLAEPLGGPTPDGFPLRLHPYDAPPGAGSRPPSSTLPPPTLRATRSRPATLTEHHTRDLAGLPPGGPATDEDLVGRELGGKLLVEALVGKGGMGAVYRARHRQLGTSVAVKVLHERFRSDLQFCARFHAEALLVSQLDHPNVVRILDYGQEADGLLYLAMDFLEGEELGELLRRTGPLPLTRIIDLGVQATAGLGHAHARGIVHRDVKPSNLVLVESDDDEGRRVELVKVCDFGIAARAGSNDRLGTPAYMSPEQCAGAECDGRSDVYSLGVILYELATGQLPFASDDEGRVLAMQREAPPPRPSSVGNVDGRLERLILAMLAKSPAARPESMRHVRAELRELTRLPSLSLHDVGAGSHQRRRGGADAPIEETPPPPKPSLPQLRAVPDGRALAAKLAREPVSTMRSALASPEVLRAEEPALLAATALLFDQRELAGLGQVVALLRRGAEGPLSDGRTEVCARLLRSLQDPARLAPVAALALAEPDEAAARLLAQLGVAAAHALYAARLRAQPTPPVRGRFVAALRGIGDASWPLVSAALRRNAPGDVAQPDLKLAEDLLRAMPLVADEALGGVVAKYLRWGDAAVRRASIAPLVSLWNDRARPLLLAVLAKDADEGARIAAVRGLVSLRAVDEHVVRKADDLLGQPASSTADGVALRVAVAEALGAPRDEARPLAAEVLRRALTPKAGLLGVLRGRAPAAPGPLVLAMACSYVAVGGADAAKVVDDLARQCQDPLRTQLLGLIR